MRIPSFRLSQPLSPVPSPKPAVTPAASPSQPAGPAQAAVLPRRSGARAQRAAILGAALALTIAGCTTAPPQPPAGPDAATMPAPGAAAPAPASASPGLPDIVRPRSRWVAAAWQDLPGWSADTLHDAWPALLRGCARPAPGWAAACAQAARLDATDDAALRGWAERMLQPYRVVGLDGAGDGMVTGYYEPLIDATRQSRGAFQTPLYAPPADLALRRPWWTRQQIETEPAARAMLRGRELAWLADPLDALVLHIQGSGRLRLLGADGSARLVRAAFAGHNDQPYRSVGRWLIEQGELKADRASWPAIKAWARLNPARTGELLWANPRYVFFREEPLPDPTLGPRGAQGVPLTPGRSIAVDAQSVPYGTPVWIDTTEPLSATPLRRLVMAQDTGSAIVGAVRADYFWGWGEAAEAQAGRMKQNLRMWTLWPR